MIERRQFREWLETALRFANAAPPDTAGKRETISRRSFRFETPRGGDTRIAEADSSFNVPAEIKAGSPKLWTEWREWLGDFQRGERKSLRNWCVTQGRQGVFAGHRTVESTDPFSFDERGYPQTTFVATSIQSMLGLVGAELIAPDPVFTVVKCRRDDCQRLTVKVLVRHRSDGRPSAYCRLPDGTSHALTSGERGRLHKAKLLKYERRAKRLNRRKTS